MIQWLGHSKLCKCYLESREYLEAIRACTDAIAISKDPEVLCDRADAYLEQDMYDEGTYFYKYLFWGFEDFE